ncbi:unnamed protein product [Larinioides sclopetarius]|uniref:C2H2-type domain-containing protein n=1 Tax=Larinioides sclopetarius TaxID=280406 RepID=A0AAV2B116_9ARAC
MACEVCHKSYVWNTDDGQFDSDAKPHVCTTCGQSFSLKIQLKRHTLLHANGAPYVCINCSKDSENDESKTYNLRLAKKSDGYVCDVCKETFSSKRMLFRHSAREHCFVKTFPCDDCPECFENAAELKKHAATHKLKNTGKRNVNKIEVSGDDSSEQSISKTFSSKKLSCHICNKSFAYQACLDKHIKKSSCKATFSPPSKTVKKPKLDIEKSEINEKKHVCNICGKNFTRKSALEGHEAIHLTEKYDSPYEEFSDHNSLHEEEVDEYVQPKKPRLSKIKIQQSYTCDSCNFVCFSKQTLAKHMNNHKENEESLSEKDGGDTENEDDNFQKCLKCDEKFNSLEALQEHSIVHRKKEDEKKSKSEEEDPGEYPCEICDKVFHSKRRLKKHLLFHVTRNIDDDIEKLSGSVGRKQRSKDFACEICGKRFAGETCLKKHIQKHENGELSEKKPKRSKKEKIIQTLICEFCNEEFTGRRGAYVKHIHSHTPEVCGICDARFVDRQGLREHCKIHVGT